MTGQIGTSDHATETKHVTQSYSLPAGGNSELEVARGLHSRVNASVAVSTRLIFHNIVSFDFGYPNMRCKLAYRFRNLEWAHSRQLSRRLGSRKYPNLWAEDWEGRTLRMLIGRYGAPVPMA